MEDTRLAGAREGERIIRLCYSCICYSSVVGMVSMDFAWYDVHKHTSPCLYFN